MTAADHINQWLDANNITEIECLVPDMSGTARGKIIPRHKYNPAEGIRMAEAVFTQTVTGDYPEEEFASVTDSDMRLLPDPTSLRLVPWAKDPSAAIIHDAYGFNGKPVEIAPRNVLKRVLQAYDDLGLKPIIAPELEFYLVQMQPDEDLPLAPPVGRTQRTEAGRQSFSIDAMNDYDEVFDIMYDWCEIQGIALDTLIHEMGPAQMEINLDHGDPLDLADQVFLFKRIAREVAIRHNMYATFMAKPMENEPGSAMHLHMSVVDKQTGQNVFSNADGSPSEVFLHAIGGMQKYFPEVIAFFAPFVNSYRRLVRYTAAPINVQWGYDNRTCGIRVPHSSPAARRIENRLPGVDCNPYLAIAVTLAAAWLGIMEKQQPSAPLEGDAYGFPFAFPRGLDDAIPVLRGCKPMAEVLGERFVNAFCAVKEEEYIEYARVISPWERRHLLLHV